MASPYPVGGKDWGSKRALASEGTYDSTCTSEPRREPSYSQRLHFCNRHRPPRRPRQANLRQQRSQYPEEV